MTVTNKYFEYNIDLIPGQTARSGQIDTVYQALQTALDGVENDLFRTIRLTAGTQPVEADFQIATDAATRANKILGFDASGVPSVLSDAGAWSGDWATSTTYLARDFVRGPESHYFSIYIAKVGHTSGVFATDLAADKWELMIDMEQIYKSRIRHQLKTNADSPIAAVAGDDLMIDISGGNVIVTLPAAPVITDAPINIMHVAGELGVDGDITIARNGKLIMAAAEDMTVDVENGSFGLAFCNDALGWRVRGV